MQGVDVVHRRRVVVGALAAAAPVAHHQLHVQEPALHFVVPVLDTLHGAGAEGDRRQAGDTGQAFLGAGVDRIGAPGVHLQLDTAQGGDRIDDGQRPAFPRQGAQGLGITAHAGGGLRVDEGQDGGVRVGVEGGCHLVDRHGLAPVVLHHDGGGATALDIFLHAPTEDPVLAHDHLVPRGQQVDEAGFHAGGAGCRHRQGQLVVSLEGVLQQGLHLVHQLHEQGVQVADGGARQGAQYPG